MHATMRAITTAAITRMTGRSVSGPGADWAEEVIGCVGGAVLSVVERGTVAEVDCEGVAVPLEAFADIADSDYYCRFFCFFSTILDSDVLLLGSASGGLSLFCRQKMMTTVYWSSKERALSALFLTLFIG